jgi:hypothetical protein
MCFDPIRKSIYVLGRYIESKPTATVSTEPKPIHESEFYQYFTELDRWIKISENTEVLISTRPLISLQMIDSYID